MKLSPRGTVESLTMPNDSHQMNWVIDQQYLHSVLYKEDDNKLFGEWQAVINNTCIDSFDLIPQINFKEDSASIIYDYEGLEVRISYDLSSKDTLKWGITCTNNSLETVVVTGFHIWMSLAYIMFRDTNVLRNMHQSAAVFPHIGGDFAKFAIWRRSNEAPHLAIYATEGNVATLGSFCRYSNKFLEQVSPSLDGVIFHRLSFIESGEQIDQLAEVDWLYDKQYQSMQLKPEEASSWGLVFTACNDQQDFYRKSSSYSHPRWSYPSVIVQGGLFSATIELPASRKLKALRLKQVHPAADVADQYISTEQELQSIVKQLNELCLQISIRLDSAGECRLELELDNGQTDFIIFNVLQPVGELLDKRAEFLCSTSFNGNEKLERPYAFYPLSNQGESLGKLSFILMKNLLAEPIPDQIHKVELSAMMDIKNHWFVQGDFNKPKALYGSFYRIYDFDYIAHVFYLLSCMDERYLKFEASKTYLLWSAQILTMRLDPNTHSSKREKEEAELVGIFVFYIEDLLNALLENNMDEAYQQLRTVWDDFTNQLSKRALHYVGAITEHFYDNAGFAPMCRALCAAGELTEAQKYAELIVANIGFSNDYRAYAPDRWWEALSYMTHSLWGGLVAGAARSVYEALEDVRLLQLSYNATMALFNCYDWHVQSTVRKLEPGEAASTFSISAPNLNMPQLSRNRFGQSVFKALDDPLFQKLFTSIEGDDWDMGEELAIYLQGFGTTTYLYDDENGQICCVNGYIVQDEDRYQVYSYAAYPTTYKYLANGTVYKVDQGKTLTRVYFHNGVFSIA